MYPQKGLYGQQKTFLERPDKVYPEGAVETKAQVQEAKEVISENRLFPYFPLLTTHAFRIQYLKKKKKTQTNHCHFLIIKCEKKVCDEEVKDGIINDTGGSLSPGNQKW